MGNTALRDLAALEDISYDDLTGSTIAIDAHNWLYKYLTTTTRFTNSDAYTTSGGDEVANLIGIVQGIPKLLEHDITPVLVFDGAASELKQDEIESRREAKQRAETKAEEARKKGNYIEAAKYDSQSQRLTDVIHETSRELLTLLDVPHFTGPGEGEAQAAHMARTDDRIDYAGTDDYDALLFGAPVSIRQLTSGDDLERMSLEQTLKNNDLTHEQLINIGILCGTDYNEGVTGYGPKTSLKAVKEHDSLKEILEAEDVTIDHRDHIQQLFHAPPVIDDYEISLEINPDIDGAREFIVEEWEVDESEIERGLDRISDAATQTGLDNWT